MTDQAPEAASQAETAPAEQGQVWYNTAPDEVKGYIQNKGWDDPLKAVTSYQELEKFRGASEKELIRLPKDPNADGAYDDIYSRLGRPEAPEKYELQGIEVDEARLKPYREAAFKAGVTQKQFEALAKVDAEFMQGAYEEHNKALAAKQEAEYIGLQKEWGANAPEREELARRGLNSMLPEGVDKAEITKAIESAIGTAATLKLFANVGEKLAREDRIPDSSGDRPFGYTREQATADKRSLMGELKADPARLASYNKGLGSDYEKMQRLNKIVAG